MYVPKSKFHLNLLFYSPLNPLSHSQLAENEKQGVFLLPTSHSYELDTFSGGGSDASMSISLRSSSGLLKNVCILR